MKFVSVNIQFKRRF